MNKQRVVAKKKASLKTKADESHGLSSEGGGGLVYVNDTMSYASIPFIRKEEEWRR